MMLLASHRPTSHRPIKVDVSGRFWWIRIFIIYNIYIIYNNTYFAIFYLLNGTLGQRDAGRFAR